MFDVHNYCINATKYRVARSLLELQCWRSPQFPDTFMNFNFKVKYNKISIKEQVYDHVGIFFFSFFLFNFQRRGKVPFSIFLLERETLNLYKV
jgi:hypothetical protein